MPSAFLCGGNKDWYHSYTRYNFKQSLVRITFITENTEVFE